MASIFGTLHIGRDALSAYQTALNVTAHNIANVNTPGYSRQRAVLETALPTASTAGALLGNGVTVQEIERIHDQYVTNQINEETETLGRWEAEKSGLERVEAVLNETSGYGLSKAMSEFWGAWQDLVNNPSGPTERQVLAGAGENLAENSQRIYNDLSQIQNEMNSYVNQTIEDISFKAGQIADINEKVVKIEAAGGNANDFRDERDVLIKELAKMVDITVVEADEGAVSVKLGDGGQLVEGALSYDLTTLTNASGFDDVAWASDPETAINASLSDGKLKGYLDVRDVAISGYKDQLEKLVSSIKGVESTQVTTDGASALSGGEYFTLSSPSENYYVWYQKDGAGADPSLGGTGIAVVINGDDTAEEVAVKTAAALNAVGGGAVFDVPTPSGTTLRIHNVVAGSATHAADNDTGFTISTFADGGNGVNTLHRHGYGLDETTDNDFFTGTLAGNDFELSDSILNDVSKIAASATLEGVPGDSTNAIAIAELEYTLTMNSHTATFDGYYNSLVSAVGTDVQQATSHYEHQDAMVSYLDNYRESISGVSLDEEMVNMLQFETAYEAAAKLINSVDKMLETLMTIV